MNTTPLYLLIADDEAAHVEAIRRAFEKAGIDVKIRDVKTLQEYRASVAERLPDIALVDLNLPDGQAMEVLTQPSEDAAFPVLVMTAFGSQEIVVDVMKAGALDYVVKSPEAFARMPKIVENGIREWKLLQRHKKAEAALQQSESKYSRLVEGAPDIIYRFSNQRGGLYYSAHAEVVLGYSVQHLLEHPFLWQTSIEPADLEFVRLAIQKLATGESFDIEYRIKDAVGKWHWLRDRSIGQSQEGDEILIEGVATDITEHKQTETYREMGREVLQILNGPDELLESIQRIIALVKTQTGGDAVGLRLQDGEDFPYFAQQGFSADFLLTENTLLERDAAGGVCRDKAGKISLECTCGLVISGKINPGHPLFTPGGSFWTSDSALLLELTPEQDPRHNPRNTCMYHGYASIALIPVRDKEHIVGLLHLNSHRKGCFTLATVKILEDLASHIGESLMRKRAEQKLLLSEQEFRSMFEVASIGMAQADPNTQHFLRVNTKMCAITGYSSDEMLKMCIAELTHPADRQQDLELFQRVVRGETPDYRIEKRYLRKDGTVVWVNVNMTIIRDAASQPVRTMATIEDITERKREAEAAIHLAKVKDKFTSVVSHELRSPLATIKEATNLILEGVLGPVNAEQKDMLNTAKINIDRLGRLVNDVLTVQKMDAGKMQYDVQENDVNEVMQEALKSAILFAGERKADLVLKLGAGLPKTKFDKDKIMQVMFNILTNAIKYSESGLIAIETCLEDCEIQISVRDSGQGIFPEEMGELFKPFSHGKGRKKGGTGLGLAISKELVLAHHGKIWVESAPGKGSTFCFTLPV